MKITGKQLAAARSLLGWSQEHLADAADVNSQTIMRWETGQTTPHESTVKRIVQVIEAFGVEFLNGGRPGVRMKGKPEAEQGTSAD